MTEAILAILLIALGIGLDRWVKSWCVRVLQPAGSIPVWEGVFHLTYADTLFPYTTLFRSGELVNLTPNSFTNSPDRKSVV